MDAPMRATEAAVAGGTPTAAKAEAHRAKLRSARLRPTRQRLALVGLLFGKGDRHVRAEDLYREAKASGVRVSLATVYNTLHALTAHGLLRQIVVDLGRCYFDTNTTHSGHLFFEDTGDLHTLPEEWPVMAGLSERLGGIERERIDVMVRVRTYGGTHAGPPRGQAAPPVRRG